VGNEPQGLWFLTRLTHAYQKAKAPLKLGWLRTDQIIEKVPFPRSLASQYAIKTEGHWNIELISKEKHCLWSKEVVQKKFPELFKGPITAEVLYKYEDLYAYALGLWKVFGRSLAIHPITLLKNALQCLDLADWDPLKDLPESVEQLTMSSIQTSKLEEFKKTFKITLADGTSLTTENLVLNMSVNSNLSLIKNPALREKALLTKTTLHSKSLYPIYLQAPTIAINEALKPITLYFESLNLPNPDTEIFPIFKYPTEESVTLKALVSSYKNFSSQSLKSDVENNLKVLNHLFPFLSEYLESCTPYFAHDCLPEDKRASVLHYFEENRIEKYRMSYSHFMTKHKRIYNIGSDRGAENIYPLGALGVTRNLILEILSQHPALLPLKKNLPQDYI
jgi:hypothetical protein